jgi:hypothetical protein
MLLLAVCMPVTGLYILKVNTMLPALQEIISICPQGANCLRGLYKMPKYNGHKNWNHWNVSLWINNDEGLYRMALESVRCCDNRQEAANNMLEALNDAGITHTPDGAPYSVTTIKAAMIGM